MQRGAAGAIEISLSFSRPGPPAHVPEETTSFAGPITPLVPLAIGARAARPRAASEITPLSAQQNILILSEGKRLVLSPLAGANLSAPSAGPTEL